MSIKKGWKRRTCKKYRSSKKGCKTRTWKRRIGFNGGKGLKTTTRLKRRIGLNWGRATKTTRQLKEWKKRSQETNTLVDIFRECTEICMDDEGGKWYEWIDIALEEVFIYVETGRMKHENLNNIL